ncbi:MAG: phosphoribosylformylglycinamidine synthase subunit PurQ [Thermodesulfobacteriota bacterium]|nr:phosphoribosylformylglycinamidine synthase subunit PurQ [Thermodesulfobacteriota bacterium]
MSSDVKALVLTGYGLNCDNETAHAFALAGANVQRVHINALLSKKVTLDDFQIMAFVGGFSWGDDHGAGVIQAHRMQSGIGDDLARFVGRGGLVIGICNGFQTLVNMGMLPGITAGESGSARSVALIANDCGNFRDDWVNLVAEESCPCVFTRGMTTMALPVRHGEGKFYCEAPVLETLRAGRQIVLRYADENGNPANGRFPDNPNGSIDDVAGICDPTGRVFGLMPHPEAYIHFTNHPDWTRQKVLARRAGRPFPDSPVTDGLQLIKNGVDFLRQAGRI